MSDAPSSVVSPDEQFKDEQWRPIAGFPGYEVSDHGRVSSFWKFRWGMGTERKIRKLVSRGAYLQVTFKGNGIKPAWKDVHLLVLEAFGGPRPPEHQGCHGPAGKLVNRLDNLSWGTVRKNNVDDRIRDGTFVFGERTYNAILTTEMVQSIRAKIRDGVPFQAIGDEFGIGESYVSGINRGSKWGRTPIEFEPKTFPIRKTIGGKDVNQLSTAHSAVHLREWRKKRREAKSNNGGTWRDEGGDKVVEVPKP